MTQKASGCGLSLWGRMWRMGRERRWLLPLGLIWVMASMPLGAQPFPVGPEEEATTMPEYHQERPKIVMAPDGSFVIAWDESGLKFQRFDSSGQRIGEAVEVGESTAVSYKLQALGMDSEGDFVVSWAGGPSGFYNVDVPDQYVRRFTSDGSMDSILQANTFTDGMQEESDLVMAPDGRFAVVWEDKSYFKRSERISGRLFSSDGQPVGDQFVVAEVTMKDHYLPSSALSGDDFLTVWVEAETVPSFSTLQSRFTNLSNGSQDVIRRVDETTGRVHGAPDVAALTNGFLVVWESQETDSTVYELKSRLLDADGIPLATETVIRSSTHGQPLNPRLAVNGADQALVVWTDPEADTRDDGVVVRYLDSQGAPLSSELLVNQWDRLDQEEPDIVATPDNEFIIVWHGDFQGPRPQGIYMRRYQMDPFVFGDGFESGDTASWSSVDP